MTERTSSPARVCPAHAARLRGSTLQRAIGLSLVASLTLASSAAFALDPASNTYVSDVSFVGGLDTYRVDDEGSTYLGIEECEKAVDADPTITVRFTTTTDLTSQDLNGNTLLQTSYTFNATDVNNSSPDCTDSDAECSEITSSNVTASSTTVDVSTSFSNLTGYTSTASCTSGSEQFFVRMTFNSPSTTTTLGKADGRIVIDGERPEPPASFTAVATDNQIKVTWEDSPSTDRYQYQVIYATEAFTGGVLPDDISVTTSANNTNDNSANEGTVDVSLSPGAQIYVTLATVDEAGNLSTVLEPQAVTVVESFDFWEEYQRQGGAETGGYCASVGAPHAPDAPGLPGALALAGLAGVLWGWRRRV